MKTQVIEALVKIDKLYDRCKEEIVLKEYISCVKRLLNSVMQMACLKFMVYERMLLWESIELFVEQFIEQIEEALICKESQKKKVIIADIENSLYEMSNVYKNVIDSTSNSDQQVSWERAMNTNMYEVSPKKSAFYTKMLKELVVKFNNNDGSKYVFLLHPTIRNKIEACLLFAERKKNGKIVIIYVPEYCIEQFDILPVHLIHEAFHVLTKAQRKRKLRAKCYIRHMLLAIEQLLFQGIDERDLDLKTRKDLLDFWLGNISEFAKKVDQMDDFDRQLYSEPLTKEFLKEIKKILIAADNKIIEGIEKHYYGNNLGYEEYLERRRVGNILSKNLRCNLFDILCNDRLDAISDMFIRIYQEGYADICCLLLLKISAETYSFTFERAKQFEVKDNYIDIEKNVREMLVANILFLQTNQEDWKHYYLDLLEKIHQIQPIESEHRGTLDVMLTDDIEKIYVKYLSECSKEFIKTLENISDIEKFRLDIISTMKMEQKDTLAKVFHG